MATQAEYRELISGCGFGSDCPLCGLDFAACGGRCGAHDTGYGTGPFHHEFSDDCPECQKEITDEQASGKGI